MKLYIQIFSKCYGLRVWSHCNLSYRNLFVALKKGLILPPLHRDGLKLALHGCGGQAGYPWA